MGVAGVLWRMRRALCSRRAAPKSWTTWLADNLQGLCGLERFAAVPTMVKKPNSKLRLEVHMDDGHGAGAFNECEDFLRLLAENVLIETSGPQKQKTRLRTVLGAVETKGNFVFD